MEWVKDKKNLPIVVGLLAFVVLATGGLIAFELGAFNGSSAPVVVVAAPAAGGYPGGAPPGVGSYPGAPFGAPRPASAPTAAPSGAKTAAAAPTAFINPLVGADPFAVPGGRKVPSGAANLKLASAALRPSLRGTLPPLDLFTLRPPRPEASSNFKLPAGADQLLATTRVSGIVNAADGIFAVVEVNGASQTVKPGDALPDGSKVASIQSTGVTLHTPGGGAITVPLSNGPPEQNQPNPYGGGFGGGGYPGGFGGGGYPGGGGGGYPGGGGFGGGGYPGGGFGGGGGGYPGGGGFGGGGGGGYPGGGGDSGGGGGGYPGGGGDNGGF